MRERWQVGMGPRGPTADNAELVDPGALVREMIERMRGVAFRAGVRLSSQVEVNDPVLADESQLARSLVALLMQAVAAARRGGSVAVDVRPAHPGHVRIAVTASAAEADTVRDGDRSLLGLGIELPLAPRPTVPPPPLVVVLVSGDEPMARSLGDALALQGHRLARANAIDTAVRLIEVAAPAAVIIDTTMEVRAMGLLRALRARRPGDRIPLVAIGQPTAPGPEGMAGVTWLRKPIDGHHVVELLRLARAAQLRVTQAKRVAQEREARR